MLYKELKERGLIYQKTHPKLNEALRKPTTFYCGFDPTSDSLHIGSLLPLITMKRLQIHGHRPLVVLGGATGLIGDPSGKSKERTLLPPDQVDSHAQALQRDMAKVLDFQGPNPAQILNNKTWMEDWSYLKFLRTVGKHFPLGSMLKKDSVQNRMENQGGLSYTEFSYMLVQAYDFYHLNQSQGCTLQIGASDQWGNITAGVELIRRMTSAPSPNPNLLENKKLGEVMGWTFPLITKPNGEKFGKTEGGNIWLNPEKTSPYQFYQFFLNLEDDQAVALTLSLSLKPLKEIQSLVKNGLKEPHKRAIQRSLAQELTEMIHGPKEVKKVRHASQALFGGSLDQLDLETFKEIFAQVPSMKVSKIKLKEQSLVELLVSCGLCSSKSEARKDLQAGAIYVNNKSYKGPDQTAELFPLLFNSLLVLRRGKKKYALIKCEEGSTEVL